MKKFLFMAAVAMMALSSCGSKEAKTEATEVAEQTEVAESEAPAAEAVIVLDDDNAYRPDTKVDGLVVLDFNATWCVPCKQLTPVFKAAAEKYPGVKFVSVDIDNLPETAKAFNIEAVPTVVFMNGEETARFVGTEDLLPAEKFDALMQKYNK